MDETAGLVVTPTRPAVVIGASLAGLFSAAAVAASRPVTILERDRLPSRSVSRRGVPQDTQAHIVLRRGALAAEGLLPGLRDQLMAAGAVCFDGGHIPWLGEFGWIDSALSTFELVSMTRPLLENVVRERVRQLPNVSVVDEVVVRGLDRTGAPDRPGWRISFDDPQGTHELTSDLVVDASGRSSRLPRWLADLGVPTDEPESLDAHLGYASRLYRARGPLPLRTGVVVLATPDHPRAGLAMPVEGGHWMVCAAGFADHRPGRDGDAFATHLSGLRDPAVRELVDLLEPAGDVHVHRQTRNRRYAYGTRPDWPDGLLAVGDALCAFDPVYGQGITVAALQAELLGRALAAGRRVDRRLQRRLATQAELPWAIATGEDRRHPSSGHIPTRSERLTTRWNQRLGRMVAAGDRRATLSFSRVYNLMAPASLLLHPALVAGAVRSIIRPPTPVPRPAVLDELSRLHRLHGSADPTAA